MVTSRSGVSYQLTAVSQFIFVVGLEYTVIWASIQVSLIAGGWWLSASPTKPEPEALAAFGRFDVIPAFIFGAAAPSVLPGFLVRRVLEPYGIAPFGVADDFEVLGWESIHLGISAGDDEVPSRAGLDRAPMQHAARIVRAARTLLSGSWPGAVKCGLPARKCRVKSLACQHSQIG
jgi:hypothetical protein